MYKSIARNSLARCNDEDATFSCHMIRTELPTVSCTCRMANGIHVRLLDRGSLNLSGQNLDVGRKDTEWRIILLDRRKDQPQISDILRILHKAPQIIQCP